MSYFTPKDNLIACFILFIALSVGASAYRTRSPKEKKAIKDKIEYIVPHIETSIEDYRKVLKERNQYFNKYNASKNKKDRSFFKYVVNSREEKIRTAVHDHNLWCMDLKKYDKEKAQRICAEVKPVKMLFSTNVDFYKDEPVLDLD